MSSLDLLDFEARDVVHDLRRDHDFSIGDTPRFIVYYHVQGRWQTQEVVLCTRKAALGFEDEVLEHATELGWKRSARQIFALVTCNSDEVCGPKAALQPLQKSTLDEASTALVAIADRGFFKDSRIKASDAVGHQVDGATAHVADDEAVANCELLVLNTASQGLNGVDCSCLRLSHQNGPLEHWKVEVVEPSLAHGLESGVLRDIGPYCRNSDHERDRQCPPDGLTILSIQILDDLLLDV